MKAFPAVLDTQLGNCISASVKTFSSNPTNELNSHLEARNQLLLNRQRARAGRSPIPSAPPQAGTNTGIASNELFQTGTGIAQRLGAQNAQSEQPGMESSKKIKKLNGQHTAAAYSTIRLGIDQNQFDKDSMTAAQSLCSKMLKGEIRDLDQLITETGDLRKKVGYNKNTQGVGELRHTDLWTLVKHSSDTENFGSYCQQWPSMKNNLLARERADDKNLLIVDMNDISKKDDNVKYLMINKKVDQVKMFICHFENDANEKIELSTVYDVYSGQRNISYINSYMNYLAKDANIDQIKIDYYDGNIDKSDNDFQSENLYEFILIQHGEIEKTELEMEKKFSMFKSALKNNDLAQAEQHSIDLVFLFANTAPYMRGSAWASEAIATAMMQCIHGENAADFFRTDLDFATFGLDQYEFRSAFKSYVDSQTA